MKIEFIYDGEGNLTVIDKNGKAEFFYIEYDSEFPEEITDFIKKEISKYKSE